MNVQNVTLLRGASAALENQLREFEVAFTGKVQELESSEIEKYVKKYASLTYEFFK